jgi:hypothetical protein
MRVYAKVIPRASCNKLEKISEGEYKVWVTAAPVDNAANKMLLQLLADYFGISRSNLKILGGKTARIKIIEIS